MRPDQVFPSRTGLGMEELAARPGEELGMVRSSVLGWGHLLRGQFSWVELRQVPLALTWAPGRKPRRSTDVGDARRGRCERCLPHGALRTAERSIPNSTHLDNRKCRLCSESCFLITQYFHRKSWFGVICEKIYQALLGF